MAGADKIIDVSDATFDYDVIQKSHEKPVVVDFWAPWCGPCRMLGPILEWFANDPAFDFILAKINVDDNPNIAMRYGVQGIPAVKAFVDGQVADEFVGAQPEPRVRQFIQGLIPNEAEMDVIHRVIYDELCAGIIEQSSKQIYADIIKRLVTAGAQGIILGCTEIGLLVKPEDSSVPLFDTTEIHAHAAVEFALEG